MNEQRQKINHLKSENRELRRQRETEPDVIQIDEEDLEQLQAALRMGGNDFLSSCKVYTVMGGMMQVRNDDNMTYEQLLALEERIGNVPVGLNERQMKKLPLLPLKEEITCSICLNTIEVGEIAKLLPKCNHSYHGDCIDEWLRAKKTCPLCLTEVI